SPAPGRPPAREYPYPSAGAHQALRTACGQPPSWLPSGHGIQVQTIREGRQNTRIWVAIILIGVRQTSAQAVLSSSSAISAGRTRFLRRRHVAAEASSTNCGPRALRQASLLSVVGLRVRERHCCRAASGARAAGGPARRVGLPSATWGPLIAG